MWFKSSFSAAGDCVEVNIFKKSTFSHDTGNCVEAGIFKTSTFSGAGGTCVEVGAAKTSSFSGGGSSCVEVEGGEDVILVRNSKNPEAGTVAFTFPEWDAFIKGAKAGEFDLPG